MAPLGRLAYVTLPLLTLLGIACVGIACTAGVKEVGPGTGGTSGSVGHVSGSAGTTGYGGTGLPVFTGTAGTGSGGSSPPDPDAAACQQHEVKFEPKTPTVYLMVDRSGSMFDCLSTTTQTEASCPTKTDTAWDKLRVATETVVATLEQDVRFGFAAFMGLEKAGTACPTLTKVAPNLMNAAAIKAAYDPLPFPPNSTEKGVKFESPASATLKQLATELMADPTQGDKYILFVTDGQPDYCDDSLSLCAPDSVISAIQKAYASGIKTIVIGLQTAGFNLAPGVLEGYANAGAGEATKAPVPTNLDKFALFDQCFPVAPWKADFLSVAPECAADSNACRGRTIGTYADTAGPTKPYKPSAGDQTQLVTQLSTALAGVKSCTFDLGGSIKVALNLLDQASVSIEGKVVPLDKTSVNGWNMATQTQLQLFGKACDDWRAPTATDIKFNFPCEIFVD